MTAAQKLAPSSLVTRLETWLSAQRLEPPGPGRWLPIYVETDGAPAWWRGGPISGHDVAAAVELLAEKAYTVRRVTRAGADVRLVEVWSR